METTEKSDEVHRFIMLEPMGDGMTVGIYGLTGIEAIGLLQAGLYFAQNKINEQISVVAKRPEQHEKD